MAQRRKDPGSVTLPLPKKRKASNGKRLYMKGYVTLGEALKYYTCDDEFEFDSLYPVHISRDEQEYEHEFGSSWDVDDFIAALPVKQMFNLLSDVHGQCNFRFLHDFVMMKEWLQTSMEISEIEIGDFNNRLDFLHTYLHRSRTDLDKHVEDYIAMQADKSITPDIVYEHGMEGFNEQKEYNLLLYLSMAMETVKAIAELYDDYKDVVCTCSKCAYYRSPKWLAERPEDMTRKELPWKSFHDVDDEVFEQIHEIYVRQHSKK